MHTIPSSTATERGKTTVWLYECQSSRDTYFARVKLQGKEIKCSPDTDGLQEARRGLRDFKSGITRIDTGTGKITLQALTGKYPEDDPASGPQDNRQMHLLSLTTRL